MIRRSRTIPPLVAVLAMATAACSTTFRAGAAVVNGERISEEQVEQRVGQQGQTPGGPSIDAARDVLIQLIQDELLRQGARRRGITVTAAEVQQRLDVFRANFGSEEEFEAAFRQRGFSRESLRVAVDDLVRGEKLAERLVGPVTDAQVQQVYEQSREQFEERRTRHILFRVDDPAGDAKARRDAERALARVRAAGESFRRVAREESDDPGSKVKGGDLGWVARDAPFDQQFLAGVFEARVGRPHGPVRSQFGYHLILVERSRIRPLSAVAGGLREQLQQQVTQRALNEFLTTEMRRARIVVNPRYGDWDPESATIVPHRFFVPAEPEVEPGLGPDAQPPIPGLTPGA